MLSTQIFKDTQENSEVSKTKNLKLSTNGKSKNLGLKNSTNTAFTENDKRSSDSVYDVKILGPSSIKVTKENESKTRNKSSETCTSQNSDDWPDVENIHPYEEPFDDYEDILPKRERITKSDLSFFFKTDWISIPDKVIVDDLPVFDEDLPEVEIYQSSPCFSNDLHDDTPTDFIPLLDISF